MKRTILCYGDSNTYGFDPRGFGGGRYPADTRWTGILDSLPEWHIINEGENGRSLPKTPLEFHLLEQMMLQAQPDGVCIMLGTNDLLCGSTARTAAGHLRKLLSCFDQTSRKLLLAPPVLQAGDWVTEPSWIRESIQYAACCHAEAKAYGFSFADTSTWEIALAFDGVHFTEEGHRRFAVQAAAVFSSVFL